jgi:hypothetical protein
MLTKYLKCDFEDGVVFFKITPIDNPEDEYIYEGLELIQENGAWEGDIYELTEADLDEMYEDGFENIDQEDFQNALKISQINPDEI